MEGDSNEDRNGILLGYYSNSTGILLGYYWDSTGVVPGIIMRTGSTDEDREG